MPSRCAISPYDAVSPQPTPSSWSQTRCWKSVPTGRERQVELLEVAVEVRASAGAPPRPAPGRRRPAAPRTRPSASRNGENSIAVIAPFCSTIRSVADRGVHHGPHVSAPSGAGVRASGSARGTAGRRSARGSSPRRAAPPSAGSRPRPDERVADADVGRQEDVGVAERAQRDVVGRPRPDAGQRRAAPGVRRRGRGRGPGRASPEASAAHSAISARPRARGIGRSSGSSAARVAASGKRWVSPSTGCATGRPCAATSRAGDRARAGDADLLAEHRADRDLVPVDVTGHPQPRPLPGPAGRSPGRRRTRRRPRPGRSRRRAAGAPARSRRAMSRRSSSANVAVTNAVCRGSRLVGDLQPHGAGAVRQRRGSGRTSPSPAASTPGTARVARKPSSARPANGVRTASRIVDRARSPGRPPRRPRRSVGDDA